ncbi:MAG: beta-galactosidase, partial [Sphingomicrobium sp.]
MIGVTYYPEQGDEKNWAADAAGIAGMGFTFVRAAEFAWSRLEPAEGIFDFGWLERVIAGLHRAGVDVVLGTPSAAPPPWLTSKYPDVLMVDENGRRLAPGSRRFNCPTNPTYRRLATRMTERMATYFGATPGVIGWQIDNELGLGRQARCYCPACAVGFRNWLQARYGNLAAINNAWGTAFWSQLYTDFEQIPVPQSSGAALNPGLQIDYDHFQSDSYVSFLEQQSAVIRAKAPRHWLTTNNLAMPTTDTVDLRRLARSLDFFSFDNYPGVMLAVSSLLKMGAGLTPETLPMFSALSHDAARSVKPGSPHLVMEQQVGKVGLAQFFSEAPAPGQIRLWALQGIAHGARGVSFHRWDTARRGAEQYWFGILDHDRTPGPSKDEIALLNRDLALLGRDALEADYPAPVALIYDYQAAWASEVQPNAGGQSYAASVIHWYAAACGRHAGIDLVDATRPLDGYRLLLAPAMVTLSRVQAERIREFVRRGGSFISGVRLGAEDDHGAVSGDGFPGLLREVMGVRIAAAGPSAMRTLTWSDEADTGASFTARQWAEQLECDTARPLAIYNDGQWAGKPAIAVNRFGSGQAVYIGAMIDDISLARLLDRSMLAAGIRPPFVVPDGVEVTQRRRGAREWVYLLNHSPAAQSVALPRPMRDLLTGQALSGSIL